MWVTSDPVTPHTTVDAEMVLKIASHCAPWLLSVQFRPSLAVWKLMLYCCSFRDEIDSPMECLNTGDSHIHQTLEWEDGEWATEMAAKLRGPRLTSWKLKLCINFQHGFWLAGMTADYDPVMCVHPDLKGSPIAMTFGYWFLCWGSQQNNIHCRLLQKCHCQVTH